MFPELRVIYIEYKLNCIHILSWNVLFFLSSFSLLKCDLYALTYTVYPCEKRFLSSTSKVHHIPVYATHTQITAVWACAFIEFEASDKKGAKSNSNLCARCLIATIQQFNKSMSCYVIYNIVLFAHSYFTHQFFIPWICMQWSCWATWIFIFLFLCVCSCATAAATAAVAPLHKWICFINSVWLLFSGVEQSEKEKNAQIYYWLIVVGGKHRIDGPSQLI